MVLRVVLLSVAAFAFAGACNKADTASAGLLVDPPTPSAEQLSEQKAQAQTFVEAAAQTNLVGVETAKLALARARNIDVKAYAQQVLDDHEKAAEALSAAAQTAGLPQPAGALDEAHLRRVNDLTGDGPQGDRNFDADFAALQIDANSDAIAFFQSYVREGQIPAVKAFAEQTLPKLREHRNQAEALARQARKDAPPPG